MIDPKVIQEKVRNAGVVGAGGAGFPTYVKFGSQAEIFLVNGAECEPLLKVDQQLAKMHASLLVRGLALGMQATGAREGILAFKAKHAEAIEAVTPLLQDGMRIFILPDVYPAGDEVITIWLATGRRVPPAALPLDVGVVVNNVQTLINVARAVDEDIPVTDKTLTITGAVKTPQTVTVPVGITYRELLDLAGGATVQDFGCIQGGPMMGFLVPDLDEPITKTTGGLLVLPASHILIKRRTQSIQVAMRIAKTTCEQCCLCTELCPRHIIGHELPPHLIVRSVNYNHIGNPSVLLSALTCSECAVCEAWACPVDISPMRLNRELKAKFRAAGARYTEPIRPVDPMAEYRLVPISRLVSRLELDEYNVKAPFKNVNYQPQTVRIKLRQHIGAPAVACVAEGDRVIAGDVVGRAPDSALGVPVHASISGIVRAVNQDCVEIAHAAH